MSRWKRDAVYLALFLQPERRETRAHRKSKGYAGKLLERYPIEIHRFHQNTRTFAQQTAVFDSLSGPAGRSPRT